MKKKNDEALRNGAKIAGETLLIPGSSLLIDGKVRAGVIHAGVGILAKIAFGFPGLLAVAANSYSISVTGKGLISNIMSSIDPKDAVLKKKIEEYIKAGLTIEEIKSGIIEDIEDIYEEAVTCSGNRRERNN